MIYVQLYTYWNNILAITNRILIPLSVYEILLRWAEDRLQLIDGFAVMIDMTAFDFDNVSLLKKLDTILVESKEGNADAL